MCVGGWVKEACISACIIRTRISTSRRRRSPRFFGPEIFQHGKSERAAKCCCCYGESKDEVRERLRRMQRCTAAGGQAAERALRSTRDGPHSTDSARSRPPPRRCLLAAPPASSRISLCILLPRSERLMSHQKLPTHCAYFFEVGHHHHPLDAQ